MYSPKSWLRPTVLASAMSLTMFAAPLVAYAEVPLIEQARETSTPAPVPGELQRFSARQLATPDLGEFEGGDPVIIVGSSMLLLILLVVFLVLILT